MINTHVKLEAKIPYGSKVVAFPKNYIIFLSLKAKFDLKCQGQGHQFSNTSEIFRRSMNNLSVKAKFQKGQIKSLKQIF